MKIDINLIPPHKKAEIRQSNRLRMILRWESELSSIGLIFFAMLVSISYILSINLSLVENIEKIGSASADQYKEIARYDNEVKAINSRLTEIKNIQRGQLYWSKLFLKLEKNILDGITISNLATKDYALFVVGEADTRDNLILFKESLQKEECFSDISLPDSSLTSRKNVDFQMDLKIKKECLK